MISAASLPSLLTVLVRWAANSSQILAGALVGSSARGEARSDSDVDLLILTQAPEWFRQERQWLQQIEWEQVQAQILEWRDAHDGRVWSRHIQLSDGTEIELSFGPAEWAALDPIDESTQQIVQNGFWILLDPTGRLNQLLQALMHHSK